MRRALGAASLDALARLGLLRRTPTGWRTRVAISGHGGVLVLGDVRSGRERRDRVGGYTSVTDLARRLTIASPGGRVLDLGTGSGFHALAASGRGAAAVGTDVNPRALELARLGSALNGGDRGDWRAGSWFTPVGGERFDEIFAVAPTSCHPITNSPSATATATAIETETAMSPRVRSPAVVPGICGTAGARR